MFCLMPFVTDFHKLREKWQTKVGEWKLAPHDMTHELTPVEMSMRFANCCLTYENSLLNVAFYDFQIFPAFKMFRRRERNEANV